MAFQLSSELHKRYRADRYIYRLPFMINKMVDDAELLETIQSRDVNPETDVFFGIPGFRALNILANYGAGYKQPFTKVVLFDQNDAQIKAMHAVIIFISAAEKDPAKFVEKYIPFHMKVGSRVPRIGKKTQTEEDRQFFTAFGVGSLDKTKKELEDYFAAEMANGLSWLSPKKFERISNMVEKGFIDTAILDMRDPERVAVAKAALEAQDLRTGAIYTSSISGFHDSDFDYHSKPKKPGSKENFFSSINSLADKKTKIIASIPNYILGKSSYGFTLLEHSKERFDGYKKLDLSETLYIFSHGRHSMYIAKDENVINGFAISVEGKYQPQDFHYEAFMQVINKMGFSIHEIDSCRGEVIFRTSNDAKFKEFAPYMAKEVIKSLTEMGVDQEKPAPVRKK